MKTLTIRQTWAWLIANGYKDIENRTWRTSYTGPCLIHTSARFDATEYYTAMSLFVALGYCDLIGAPIPSGDLIKRQCGHILGQCSITGCVTQSPSPWFFGPYGFTLENAVAFDDWEKYKARGHLGFWNYEMEEK